MKFGYMVCSIGAGFASALYLISLGSHNYTAAAVCTIALALAGGSMKGDHQ